VNHAAAGPDGIEIHLVAQDLDGEERARLIVAFVGQSGRSDIAGSQLAARSTHEVDDAVLWLDTFVEVIVTGEHDTDTIVHEDRLELVAQPGIGSVPATRRIERVMERSNFPVLARSLDLALDPVDLFRRHVV